MQFDESTWNKAIVNIDGVRRVIVVEVVATIQAVDMIWALPEYRQRNRNTHTHAHRESGTHQRRDPGQPRAISPQNKNIYFY